MTILIHIYIYIYIFPSQHRYTYTIDFGIPAEAGLPGSFTKVKQLSSCCRGEGSIELHRFTSASSTEEVVVKKLLVVVEVRRCGGWTSTRARWRVNRPWPWWPWRWRQNHGLKTECFFPIDIHRWRQNQASKKVRYFDGWEFKHPQMVLVSDWASHTILRWNMELVREF